MYLLYTSIFGNNRKGLLVLCKVMQFYDYKTMIIKTLNTDPKAVGFSLS